MYNMIDIVGSILSEINHLNDSAVQATAWRRIPIQARAGVNVLVMHHSTHVMP